jgi:AhpD family alkylhydroperoxidase
MKNLALATTLLLAAVVPANADHTTAPAPAPAPATTPAAVFAELDSQLGFVPQFIRAFPEALLPGFWSELKSLEMNPNTALDNKTKELIGLAVASQIPCQYCVYFHTRAAKANGATDAQVSEAIGMASLTRAGSTVLQGTQADLAQFKKDVDRIYSKAHK